MEKTPRVILSFERHGDPDRGDPGRTVVHYPLTATSIEKLNKIGLEFGVPVNQSLGFAGSNKRSVDTIKALFNREIHSELQNVEAAEKVRIDDSLLYRVDNNFTDFKMAVNFDPVSKKLFKLIVNHSDAFKKSTGENITAYTDMARIVAYKVLKYAKVFERWEGLVEKYESDSLLRLFCMNEYFYPSFRSQITSLVWGVEAGNAYVEWFDKNQDRNESVKYDRVNIVLQRGEDGEVACHLSDSYGNLQFKASVLKNI